MQNKINKDLQILTIHGECLLEMEKLILDGVKVNAVITDPPYGTTACKWDSIIPFKPMWERLIRIVEPNGAIVFMSQNPFTSALIMSNPKMFKQSLVWVKNKASGHLNAKRRHLTKHEDIVLFSNGQVTYNQQRSTGHAPANYAKRGRQSECYNVYDSTVYKGGNTDRCPTTLIEIPVMNNDGSNGKKIHPTQKPVALMEYLINTYTNKGETVLDFAMGSGTTGVACVNTGRRFIGIEQNEKYFCMADNRICEAQNTGIQMKLF